MRVLIYTEPAHFEFFSILKDIKLFYFYYLISNWYEVLMLHSWFLSPFTPHCSIHASSPQFMITGSPLWSGHLLLFLSQMIQIYKNILLLLLSRYKQNMLSSHPPTLTCWCEPPSLPLGSCKGLQQISLLLLLHPSPQSNPFKT